MEEEKQTITKSKQQSFISKEKLRTLLSQVQRFNCVKNNKTLYVCAQKTCQKPGFICIVQDCQCKQIHLNCRSILLKRIVNSIFSKTKETPPEVKQSYQLIYDKINQMIDELSQLRSRLEVEEEFFGLMKQDLPFIRLLKQDQINQISGKIISQMEKTLQTKLQFYVDPKKQIQKSFQRNRKEFANLIKKIEKRYSKRKQVNTKYLYLNKNTSQVSNFQNLPANSSQFTEFKYVPIQVNQQIGQYKNGVYIMQKPEQNKKFKKISSDYSWKQVVSKQELPNIGKFYFQIQCFQEVNNEAMIGIITDKRIDKQSSYSNEQAISYYAYDGCAWYNGTGQAKVGRNFNNHKGLVSVLVDLDESMIYWCLDNTYQGQTQINQNLKDKPLYAYIDIYRVNTVYEFKGVQYD